MLELRLEEHLHTGFERLWVTDTEKGRHCVDCGRKRSRIVSTIRQVGKTRSSRESKHVRDGGGSRQRGAYSLEALKPPPNMLAGKRGTAR